MRRYLQYLWLKGVYYRRIIYYIGNLEGSKQYRYIFEECGEEYSRMCSTMPSSLKRNGFDMIFRNIIITQFSYEKIYNILRYGRDPVMARRTNETMKGALIYLMVIVAFLWAQKLLRDGKGRFYKILRIVKWSKKRIYLKTLRNTIMEIEFDCVIMANKAYNIYPKIRKEVYANLCKKGLKPLFILFSNRYFIERKNEGYILEIPLEPYIFRRFSTKERSLLNKAHSWASHLENPWKIRKRIINNIHANFLRYIYFREIAIEILGTGKAKCLLSFTENVLEYRVFLHVAKKYNLQTVLYYVVDGIHQLRSNVYHSDTIMVCNRRQYRNFLNIGYLPEKCKIVGSFNVTTLDRVPIKISTNNPNRRYNILYFTKGRPRIDEALLDELIEKLKSINISYQIIIKKHPRDQYKFKRFKNMGAVVTGDLDYWRFVGESDLVISQYSGVVRSIIPLRKPLILYTYSEFIEFGEREFFRNAQLPNYIQYVQNKQEFHCAIEQLLELKEPEPLPEKLAEDLYGYMDANCGNRIAEIVNSFVVESTM